MSYHVPIMLEEIKTFVQKYKAKKVLDLTFGAGGHSKLFLNLGCNVIAFDRDQSVRQFLIDNKNFTLYIEKFSNFHLYAKEYDIIFADLGMSTMQLESSRGFSFMKDSELDMRMDTLSDPLWKSLNTMNSRKMEDILKEYGQVVDYKRIVRNIEMFRLITPIKSTFQLRKAVGTDNFKTLAQIFQSFRIYLNDELNEIKKMLSHAKPTLGALFLTFHSLEDKLIKNFCKNFKYNGFSIPTNNEKEINSKSRNTKLRFAFKEKL